MRTMSDRLGLDNRSDAEGKPSILTVPARMHSKGLGAGILMDNTNG